MIKRAVFTMLIALPGLASAAGGGMHLESPNINLGNIASLQRGAQTFVNHCMGCHSAQFVRFNRLSRDLGLTEDQIVNNLIFTGAKPHETMNIAMPSLDGARWFGQTPPDLSLVARARGADFVYTFMKTFYVDESRPNGVNNLALPGASMPHVLWELQGLQALETAEEDDGHGGTHEVVVGLKPVTEGSMTPEEYDVLISDLVNFLVYIGEPVRLERERLGIRVLAFLLVFFLFAYALKKEYWRDVH